MKRLQRVLSCLLLCALLAGTAGIPASALSDVPEDFWAREDIDRCISLRYFYPESDGSFGVGKEMTRAEFVVVLCRTLGWKPTSSARAVYEDVSDKEWYAGAVERVCAAGLMNGTSPTAFSPGETVTRGQITAILHRLAGKPEVRGSSFSDVPDSAYYSGAVAWAARRGVVEGFYDGTFRPDLPVSRQQLASILWRYAKLERADRGSRASLRGFPDAGDVADYAGEAMSWALAEGILQGTKEGRLQPQGRAARGQTAVLLERFQTLLERT